MRRGRLGAAVIVAGAAMTVMLLAGAGPAAAIETTEFRLDPAGGGAGGGALRLEVAPRREARGSVELTNKTDHPITIRLAAVPATVGAGGAVSLKGDPALADRLTFERDVVRLAPGAARVVGITLDAPEELDPGQATLAVLAQPVAPAGAHPNVIQQLALVANLEPATGPSPLARTVGAIAWAGAGVLAAVGLATARSSRTGGRHRAGRRHRPGSGLGRVAAAGA